MHTIKDIHKDYVANVEDPIETRLFRQLCEEFNMLVIDMLSKSLRWATIYLLFPYVV